MNKRIVLFDIDHTIFNTSAYAANIGKILSSFVEGDAREFEVGARVTWTQIHKQFGYFSPGVYISLLFDEFSFTRSEEELQKAIVDEKMLASCLYPEVKEAFITFSKHHEIEIGVFSSGDLEFQRQKVKAISRFLHPSHMHIFVKKTEELDSIFRQYDRANIYVVDDLLKVLHQVKIHDKSIQTVWMKRGKWLQTQEKPEGFMADFEVESVKEVVGIVAGEEN